MFSEDNNTLRRENSISSECIRCIHRSCLSRHCVRVIVAVAEESPGSSTTSFCMLRCRSNRHCKNTAIHVIDQSICVVVCSPEKIQDKCQRRAFPLVIHRCRISRNSSSRKNHHKSPIYRHLMARWQ